MLIGVLLPLFYITVKYLGFEISISWLPKWNWLDAVWRQIMNALSDPTTWVLISLLAGMFLSVALLIKDLFLWFLGAIFAAIVEVVGWIYSSDALVMFGLGFFQIVYNRSVRHKPHISTSIYSNY